MGPPGMEERVGRTGGRSPVPQILPACKTFHLNSNPAVLLGPGRAAPDAKVGPSPCPRQSGREGSAALSLNLNRALWPRPDRRLETWRSEAAGMVNADPEPTEQTSRSPPSSPRKSEPSLRPPPPTARARRLRERFSAQTSGSPHCSQLPLTSQTSQRGVSAERCV